MRKAVGIVDDNPTMLGSLDRLLRAAGYDTELFSSGEALLESIATSTAGCLVIDIHLGGVSGIELARRLAELGSTLPVIFMSGAVERTIEAAAAKAGASRSCTSRSRPIGWLSRSRRHCSLSNNEPPKRGTGTDLAPAAVVAVRSFLPRSRGPAISQPHRTVATA